VIRPDSSDAAVLQIADAVGALMEAWGFKRNLGRLWTILYLEDRPLSAPEIGERLALSSGAVSMLLTELGQWGAARKTWIVGERREHYEAETSIWKMVSRVFRERELRWIQTAREQFEAAQVNLGAADATADTPRARLIAERVASLTELARVGAHLLEAMLQGEAVDHMPIKKLGELARLAKPEPER
jgi:HTH-type transcriptional regulator, glycine betaine synthesis regulator